MFCFLRVSWYTVISAHYHNVGIAFPVQIEQETAVLISAGAKKIVKERLEEMCADLDDMKGIDFDHLA